MGHATVQRLTYITQACQSKQETTWLQPLVSKLLLPIETIKVASGSNLEPLSILTPVASCKE